MCNALKKKYVLGSLLLTIVLSGPMPVLAKNYVVHVNGIVCGFCSLGVAKKVSALPFIDQNRYDKGVDVAIENQLVTIAVKEDAALDQVALFAAIEDAGYNPVEIWQINDEGARVPVQP